MSAVTLAELEFGIACSGLAFQATKRAALASLLEDILVAPFDAQAAMADGPIRAAYKNRNQDALDKLIAAHAIALGVTLVTHNQADFVGYCGLKVDNWANSQ